MSNTSELKTESQVEMILEWMELEKTDENKNIIKCLSPYMLAKICSGIARDRIQLLKKYGLWTTQE